MSIQTTTLANGLRIITDHVESMHSVAFGIWTGVGARHENIAQNGVAHMVEHMLFKGTDKRDALKIVEDIENVGGSMNAYTSREVTSYHLHMLAQDTPLGLEVLADMYRGSTLLDEEIERERGVIIQEIGMCNDTPDDLVFDLFSETAYPKQTLGTPILGRVENIEGMRKSDLRHYIDTHYTPANTVISAAGAVNHSALVTQVTELFGNQNRAKRSTFKEASYKGGETRIERDLEQAHFILGFQGISRMHEDYYAAQILSSILGSGMSSRLFQEVREKRGLVYSIFSFHSGYQDDGQFGIYAGTGGDKMKEIIPVICDEVMKIGEDVSEEELERAKIQLKAGMLMGRESMMTRADQQAKYMLFRDEVFNLNNMIAEIDRVDIAALKRVAKRIFSGGQMTLAALGPLGALESFDSIERRLNTKKAA